MDIWVSFWFCELLSMLNVSFVLESYSKYGHSIEDVLFKEDYSLRNSMPRWPLGQCLMHCLLGWLQILIFLWIHGACRILRLWIVSTSCFVGSKLTLQLDFLGSISDDSALLYVTTIGNILDRIQMTSFNSSRLVKLIQHPKICSFVSQ